MGYQFEIYVICLSCRSGKTQLAHTLCVSTQIVLIWFFLSWKQIVDSVIALFRVDFSGRGELAEHQVFSSVHCEAIVKKVEGHHFVF